MLCPYGGGLVSHEVRGAEGQRGPPSAEGQRGPPSAEGQEDKQPASK